MKELNEKMKRFVELSKKFSKSESDILTDDERAVLNNSGMGTITIGTGSLSAGSTLTIAGSYGCEIDGRELYVDDNGNVKAKDKKEVKRSDKLRVHAEARAELLDELEEYKKLQGSLSRYFNALEDL